MEINNSLIRQPFTITSSAIGCFFVYNFFLKKSYSVSTEEVPTFVFLDKYI